MKVLTVFVFIVLSSLSIPAIAQELEFQGPFGVENLVLGADHQSVTLVLDRDLQTSCDKKNQARFAWVENYTNYLIRLMRDNLYFQMPLTIKLNGTCKDGVATIGTFGLTRRNGVIPPM